MTGREDKGQTGQHLGGDLTETELAYLSMMYEQHWEHGRSHEAMRGTASSIFVGLIAGALAFASTQGIPDSQLVSGFIVASASILGFLLNLKHFERFKHHQNMLRRIERGLAKHVRKDVESLGENVRSPFAIRYPIVSSLQLHWLWPIIFVLTGFVGAVLIFVNLVRC